MEERGEKIIPVKPFNDIWYKNCFYNAMIPVIQYYFGRIDSFMISELGTFYTYKDMDGVPSITCTAIEETELFPCLERMGILCIPKLRTDTIIEDIRSAINANKMVIIGIDCFYERKRSDTFHKNHWAHVLLVHGFSNDKLKIVESRYMDSVIYENIDIPCSELKECYEGFLEHFGEIEQPTYFEFSSQKEMADKQKSDARQRDVIRYYLNEMILKRQQMEESVENIKLFSDKLIFRASDEFYQKLFKVIEDINSLINNLQVNQYIMEKLFSENTMLTDQFNETVRLWNGVRSCLAKIYYSKSCSNTLMDGIKKKLNTLYELERKRISICLPQHLIPTRG